VPDSRYLVVAVNIKEEDDKARINRRIGNVVRRYVRDRYIVNVNEALR